MCLDAHAHGMRSDHEIFTTPHTIELSMEDRPTPEAYARSAPTLGKTMPMWRVQTEGYSDKTGQLVGVVSRIAGFRDSPDAEWISGGTNSKHVDAVALGRHGNFFHWGFAASPTYLTDEAKLVFINALHYIARFDRQRPIARKVAGIMIRESLDGMLHGISDEGYAATCASYAKYQKAHTARQAALKERVAKGETLSRTEQMMLGRPGPTTPGRFDSLKRIVPSAPWTKLGEDVQAVETYVRSNAPYLHPSGRYQLAVDEELKAFGVPSSDPTLLAQAIKALGNEDTSDLARSVLTRYTEQSLESPEAWAAWLNAHREHLFFSEAAGYKWLVNERAEASAPTPTQISPTAAHPVAAAMTLAPLGEGRCQVTVRVMVLGGWHTYDRVPPGSAFAPLQLELELPDGVGREGAWVRPPSRPDALDARVSVFEGDLTFRCELKGEGLKPGAEIRCRLTYAACDPEMCMPLEVEVLRATLAR